VQLPVRFEEGSKLCLQQDEIFFQSAKEKLKLVEQTFMTNELLKWDKS